MKDIVLEKLLPMLKEEDDNLFPKNLPLDFNETLLTLTLPSQTGEFSEISSLFADRGEGLYGFIFTNRGKDFGVAYNNKAEAQRILFGFVKCYIDNVHC